MLNCVWITRSSLALLDIIQRYHQLSIVQKQSHPIQTHCTDRSQTLNAVGFVCGGDSPSTTLTLWCPLYWTLVSGPDMSLLLSMQGLTLTTLYLQGQTGHPRLLKALLKPGHVGLHQALGLSAEVRGESKTPAEATEQLSIELQRS